MASPITASGLGSNLDVAGLVQKLMDVERQPVTKLDSKEAAVQVKISAYGTLRGSLTSFHSAVKSLTDGTRFSATRALVGDNSVASATAANGATAGSYSLEVTNLAKAQKLNSTPFTNTTDIVGTGTITVQFGTYDSNANTFTLNANKTAQSLTIDAAHSSLSGVRDAINAAGIGVSATIVNDGTGNRLVVTSKDTGVANSVRINVSDGDGNNTDTAGLSKLAYDPTAVAGSGKNMSQLVSAQDATLLIDGLPITKSTNTISNAIQGVTLQLTKTNVNAPTTLTVSQDTSAVTNAVNSFVSAYNDLGKTLTDLGKYDAGSQKAGPLQGDVTLRTIVTELQSDMTSQVQGLTGRYTALPTVGLSFDRNGKLTLDPKKLQDALAADPSSVQKLFTAGGDATDSLVSYVGSGTRTQPGNYDLSVTQLATQGQVTASSAAALLIDSSNDQISLSVDGVSTSVALTQGTYASADALAAELQSKVNGAAALTAAGASVKVTASGGVLTLTSNRYGSSSVATIQGGIGAANLFGATPTATAGVDVGGTLGGASASGAGQQLTALGGSPADGLQVKVQGGAIGQRGQIRFSMGIAAQLDAVLTQLESTKSSITARTDSLARQVKDIGTQRDAINQRLVAVEERYKKQFGALDLLLTQMQQTSSSLAQQLASLPGVSSR
jgi:flagellar hook-associated protein 2